MYHVVDLTDHAYHALARHLKRFNISYDTVAYLSYSNKAFKRLLFSKCHMNRTLMPDYLESLTRHGFKYDIQRVLYSPNTVHPEVLENSVKTTIDQNQVASFFVFAAWKT
jgi:hypothetical protein